MKRFSLILFAIAVLAGCSSLSSSETFSSYPSAIAWNNMLYGLSATEVPVQDIGKQLGKVERRISPMPKKNGDANDKPVGSLLFEVKGMESKDVIAVKVNETYFSASKLGPLN